MKHGINLLNVGNFVIACIRVNYGYIVLVQVMVRSCGSSQLRTDFTSITAEQSYDVIYRTHVTHSLEELV